MTLHLHLELFILHLASPYQLCYLRSCRTVRKHLCIICALMATAGENVTGTADVACVGAACCWNGVFCNTGTAVDCDAEFQTFLKSVPWEGADWQLLDEVEQLLRYNCITRISHLDGLDVGHIKFTRELQPTGGAIGTACVATLYFATCECDVLLARLPQEGD